MTGSRKPNPGATSENTIHAVTTPGTTCENTEHAEPGGRRRGAQPTLLSAEFAELLIRYAAALSEAPLTDDTRRTYLSRGADVSRVAGRSARRPCEHSAVQARPAHQPADPRLGGPRLPPVPAARRHPELSVRYSKNALAALDDFHVGLSLGKVDTGRDDLPRTAAKALDDIAQIRWLRSIHSWPHARDQLLASLPFYAGLRVGDAKVWQPTAQPHRPGATEVPPSEFLAELIHLGLVVPGPWPVAFKISIAVSGAARPLPKIPMSSPSPCKRGPVSTADRLSWSARCR